MNALGYVIAAILLLGLGALLYHLLRGAQSTEAARLAREADAARRAAEALVVREGHETALIEIKSQYASALAKLDERQRALAAQHLNDPGALADFLVRAAGGSQKP